MNTRLLLALITAASFAFSVQGARNIQFKDGTSINADIHGGDWWGPNAEGLVLKLNNKVYFHHYPSTADSLAPPIRNGSSPMGLPSCVPSRISFTHFSNQTQRALIADFRKVDSPQSRLIQSGIVRAMRYSRQLRDMPSDSKSRAWQQKVESEMNAHFRNNNAVWGKHLEPSLNPIPSPPLSTQPVIVATPQSPKRKPLVTKANPSIQFSRELAFSASDPPLVVDATPRKEPTEKNTGLMGALGLSWPAILMLGSIWGLLAYFIMNKLKAKALPRPQSH